jgi:hypothetical protein
VVDLSSSSDEEGLIHDTSWDAEFTRRLFGELNRDVLRPLDDDKIIILSVSDEEEEEVREETTVDTDVMPSSAVRSLAPTASLSMPIKITNGCITIIVMVLPLIGR